jgi:hypothetical protein
MQIVSRLTFFLLTIFALSSCEFHCSVGKKDEADKAGEKDPNAPVHKEGAAVYNNIQLTAKGVKVDKAYLITATDGKRVAEGNFVDFSQPVKLIIEIDSGWVEKDGKVVIGASEKMSSKNTVIIDEKDLFAQYEETGVDASDAKTIGLSVTLNLPKDAPPNDFDVVFRVWDKRGNGYIEGSYKLYSK